MTEATEFESVRDYVVAELLDYVPDLERLLEVAGEARQRGDVSVFDSCALSDAEDRVEKLVERIRERNIPECVQCDRPAVGIDVEGEPACSAHFRSRPEGRPDRDDPRPPRVSGRGAPRGASSTDSQAAAGDEAAPQGSGQAEPAAGWPRADAVPEPGGKAGPPSGVAKPLPWLGASKELEGVTFGLLTVEASAAPAADGSVQVACRCTCGRVAVRRVRDLHLGRARACKLCRQPNEGRLPPHPKGAALDWLADIRQDARRLAEAMQELDALVVAHLIAEGKGAGRASRQRQQARAAALRRIRIVPAADIAHELGVEVSVQTIYQWIARGRQYAIDAIDRRLRELPRVAARGGRGSSRSVEAQRLGHMRALLAAARSDAGKPRPHRRKETA